MNARAYLIISDIVFGIVAVLHLLRVDDWSIVLGSWTVPIWISWLATIGPFFLCIWAIRLAMRFR